MDHLIGQDVLGAETAVLGALRLRPVHHGSQLIEMEHHLLDVFILDLVVLHEVGQDIDEVMGEEAEPPFLDPGIVGVKGGFPQPLDHLVEINVLVASR